MATADATIAVPPESRAGGALLRNLTIGLISFLTFVDLFAAQAILPSLVERLVRGEIERITRAGSRVPTSAVKSIQR